MAVELIKFSDVLDKTELDTLYPKLLSSLLEDTALILDCEQVEQVDTAAMQLLYAFNKEAKIHGKNVQWGNVSEAFLQSARLLGIAGLMANLGANDVD
jgi:ABC-type transporter Mla MlaB component